MSIDQKIAEIHTELTQIASSQAKLLSQKNKLQMQLDALRKEQQGQLTLNSEQESRLAAMECGSGGCE